VRPIPAFESMTPDREVMCLYYDSCLDLAVHSRWLGFACRGCPDFRKIRWRADEWTQDALACAKLIRAVFVAGIGNKDNLK
jgi:hypothetical protein